MKKKFSKIWSVGLVLVLAASLMAFAAPVAAAPGPTVWATNTLPGVTGSVLVDDVDVTEIAVASDGTIYAVNVDATLDVATAAVVASGRYHMYKSTNGGQSWTGINLQAITAIAALGAGNWVANVAVAPDNPDVVAIATRDFALAGPEIDTVFVSQNGGSTWSQLPILAGSNTNRAIIDLAVGPARSGTALGRDYLVACADEAANDALGDLQIIGTGYGWASVGTFVAAGNAANVCESIYDYVACAFSPNFLSDRSVAAVAVNGDAAGVFFQIVNAVSLAQIRVVALTPTGVAATTTDLDYTAPAITNIRAADIALPTDWSPLTTAGERSYAAFAAVTTPTDNGVYRIDATTARELGLSGNGIQSIAFSGTIDAGTLFAAYSGIAGTELTTVKRTADPVIANPTWATSKKGPTGTQSQIIRLAADYATSSTVYAGTGIWRGAALNDESAFSVSVDNGVSFNQRSLIDAWAGVTVVNIDSVMLTPDGGTIFMATDDATDASLWKSATSTGSTTWERIRFEAGATASIVRLNPDWVAKPAVYWVETTAAGNIWVSKDGGSVFATQNGLAGATQDAVVESDTILYVASGALVYKSANSAGFFGSGKNALAGAIISLAMAPTYPAVPVAGNLLVGGTGACCYSTDGGATFTKKAGGLAAAGTYQICADEAYVDNSTIYCGNSLAGSTDKTLRFVIGTSTTWTNLSTGATGECVGLGLSNGVCYSVESLLRGVNRTLTPLGAAGTIAWERAATGLVAPSAGAFGIAGTPNILTVANNVLYVPDRTAGAPYLWAMSDTLATVKPVITSPADGATIPVDPTLGRGIRTTVTWDAIGSGSSLVNEYEMRVYSDAEGFAGAATTGVDAVGNPLGPSRTVASAGADCNASWIPNAIYTIQVRARNVVAGPAVGAAGNLRSNWSDAITVTIEAGGLVQATQAGPLLQGPAGGATDVSLTPGFSWAPIAGTTEYEFILATDAGLTNTVEGTPVYVTQPSWQVPSSTLEYSTTYFWGVKATKPTESIQSIGTFITVADAAEAEPSPLLPYLEMIPMFAWVIIAVGAVLVVAVIVLIARTRRPV